MLETLAQQIKEFGKKISTYKYKTFPNTTVEYEMNESTRAYILYDPDGCIKEVKFYRYEV